MYRKGKLIIAIEGEKRKISLRKADNQQIDLDVSKFINNTVPTADCECSYLSKGKQLVIFVNNHQIYNHTTTIEEKPAASATTVVVDWRSKIKDPQPEEERISRRTSYPMNDIFDLKKTRVPRDTRLVDIKTEQIDNFYLKFYNFAYYERPSDNREPAPNRFHFSTQNGMVKERYGNLFSKESLLADKITSTATALFSSEKGNLLKSVFSPEWRFVTGLGAQSVYEVGITLHHIYGVPFIPSSSIKGVLRAWIICSIFGNNENDALESAEFCRLLGCQKNSVLGKAYSGDLVFFDAFPEKSPELEVDILNPHFSKYYTNPEINAPLDTDSPIPVKFLTVANTPFRFLIGSHNFHLAEPIFSNKSIETLLNEALSEHGIGAKTATGYGYFKKINSSGSQ